MGDRYLPHRSIAVVLAAVVVIFLLLASDARADARYQGARVTANSARVLTRMCVGETGSRNLYACVAQVGVIARRAARHNMRIETMARLYSSALKYPRRSWILTFVPGGARPPSFPAASWSLFSARVVRLERVIASQLAGEVPDPCLVAMHFGSVRLDGHRARRAGWIRVCRGVDADQGLWVPPADILQMQRDK